MTAGPGCVLWVTGLSGAGKTTLTTKVRARLLAMDIPVLLLDGDAVRFAVGDASCGFDEASRRENAFRMCRFAKLAADQGMVVVVATISMFHVVHAWNRQNLPGYFEVYLRASRSTRVARDHKGIYSESGSRAAEFVVGDTLVAEEPEQPDLIVDNDVSDLAFLASHADRLATMVRDTYRGADRGAM